MDDKKHKQNLGQFMTSNYDYILQNFNIPSTITNIIEPFAGCGDLLKFIKDCDLTKYNIECYDIEPQKDFILKKDTIFDPPSYHNKFIITNPPFLAKNKSSNKTLYDKYGVSDLYKCFIKEITMNSTNNACGVIIILPLNFWSSIQKNDILLRKDFLDKYRIIHLNIFQEKVFVDTTYTICSFQFELKKENYDVINNIHISFYPSGIESDFIFDESNNYTYGGEIYNLKKSDNYRIVRLTSKNKYFKNNNFLIKCIDDDQYNKINLSLVSDEKVYIDETPNLSSRSYASVVITPEITMEKQKMVVEKFNKILNDYRTKYYSLFLTNYRESKNNFARKRISFDFAYTLIHHVLDLIDNEKE